jgi:hypothetical protein
MLARNPSSRGRSSIPPPHHVSPAPRSFAAYTDATVHLVEVPRHLEGRWGGPRHTDKGEKWRSSLRVWIFPVRFPGFSLFSTKVPIW